MSNMIRYAIWITLMLFLCSSALFAQGHEYEGPEDPAGDQQAVREGYMTGNRILLYFKNTTELANWTATYRGSQWSRWPNDDSGTRMLDGIALLIGARVFLKNDTIPVDNLDEVYSTPGIDTLWYLQTSYREEMDEDPTETIEWGLYPVFGYFNPLNDYPAMSNDSTTWPLAGWPASGYDLKWPGEWNGRFGRGIKYAQLETYFVANDAQDQEYLGPEDRVKYSPRAKSGIRINADNSTQPGKPWGGLGIRVEQRGFQWSNVQTQDAIFWEYSIANISDYNLTEVAFGYWVDNGIGGEADDELGFFDRKIDMAYSWDIDGTGAGGLKTGTMGFAYLESPGIYDDGEDNDQDGLTDERRDNPAGELVGPYYHITNLENFLETYNLKESELKEHYEGDEDQDWQNGFDKNGNGTYVENIGTDIDPQWVVEDGEYVGDDVGLDGVGPYDLNYDGPDEGEGNGRPDYKQGVGCEPNFNATDVSESDMVGLTSFRLFPIPQHRPPWTRWFKNDKSMWEIIGTDSTLEYLGNISNLVETFASGPFPLPQGTEERISMSELHSFDALAGLNSDEHSAPILYQKKKIVQVIYEKDYRFARAPEMPTLSATPADGKVILTWDNRADQMTREPLLGNINDFQGYKLIKATDKNLADPLEITNGYGEAAYYKPIFQCDLKDSLEGFATWGIEQTGIAYNLGSNTGIIHHFVDNAVQNGRTYYYALIAYDYGIKQIGKGIGIAPSQTVPSITLNESEEVVFTSPNIAIVTPHQLAAGYVPPSIDQTEDQQTLGTGTVGADILASGDLKQNHDYMIKFKVDTLYDVGSAPDGLIYTNNGFEIYDITNGKKSLVYEEKPDNFAFDHIIQREDTSIAGRPNLDYWALKSGQQIETDVFEGMRMRINIPVETAAFDAAASGWQVGDADINITTTVAESQHFPWDYYIIFTGNDSVFTGEKVSGIPKDENGVRIDRHDLLNEEKFSFYVENRSFLDSTGAYRKMNMIGQDMNSNVEFDILEDRILVGSTNEKNQWAGTIFIIDFNNIEDPADLPQADDFYKLTFQRPFVETDSITFTVLPEGELDTQALKTDMDDIKVVPNPYIATNLLETAISNPELNQRRRLMFTHVPARCTIKIFTASGMYVDEINVNNAERYNDPSSGIAYWDLTSHEGLDIAAGIYIYHIKSDVTGEEKMGKFAVIK